VTVTQIWPDRTELDDWPVACHIVAPTAIATKEMAPTTHMARRSRGVSGSVGGVLPALTVGGSIVGQSIDKQ
jgi:hypothetical protein